MYREKNEGQPVKLPAKGIEDIIALTPVQEGMLFHYLKEQQRDTYFEQLSLEISGKIDIPCFEKAWDTVAADNEMLRAVFRWEKVENPLQLILKEYHVQISYEDFTGQGLNEREIQKQLEKLETGDRQAAFDLGEVPFRITLCKTGERRYVMIISNHHILYDGWSNGIILKEFFAAYQSLLDHKTPVKKEKTAFKEFVRWVRDQDKSGQEAFWRDYLEGFETSTGLPWKSAAPGENLETAAGNEVYSISFAKDFTEKLADFTRDRKLTPASVCYGAWARLLQLYNSSDDVVFGTTVSGRTPNIKGIEDIVGLFINTVPLRVRPFPQETIDELLTGIDRSLKIREPFECASLADIKKWSSVTADAALFDSIVVMENYPLDSSITQEKRELSPTGYSAFHCTNYPLNLGIMTAGENETSLRFVYDARRLGAETVRALALGFKYIVRQMTEYPGKKVCETDILSPKEKEKILLNLNRGWSHSPPAKTLVELFENQAAATPDHIAITAPDADEHYTLTYRELNEKANRLAYLLRSKGVQPGAIAALMTGPSFKMVIAILAVLKAGGAYLPIDPTYPRDRVRFMLEDCRARILLTTSGDIAAHGFTTLRGLEYRETKYHMTAPRAPIADLDAQPVVDRTTVSYENYNRYIGQAMVKHCFSIQATRGCPYRCAYCHKIWPKKHVYRSAEHIFAEVRRCYDVGVRRFAFIDDIFNLNIENSRRFFQLIIDNNMKVQFFFPNGLRGDLLTPDYIDLMVQAGTVNIALALETASPRLQKLLAKNLDVGKLKENLEYLCERYPGVILELFTMHGFPTETEAEAQQTLDFIKSLKWLHFPYVHILKIYPNTDMALLAEEHGIPAGAIARSANLAYHQLPDTLPFDKQFTLKYQADFLHRYFLLKERLLHVLPLQMKTLTEDEIVQKYHSYLPVDIKNIDDLLQFAGIGAEEIDLSGLSRGEPMKVPDLDRRLREISPASLPRVHVKDKLNVLLLDLSQLFSSEEGNMLYNLVEPPLGLMYLATALNREFEKKISARIAKSRIDFDNYEQLKALLDQFKPNLIGIRTLTYYKDFSHQTAAIIRQWGYDGPIIAGGPYATSDYAFLLQDRNIDLVVLGEGERTLCEIAGKMLENNLQLPEEDVLKEIAGIVYMPWKNAAAGAFTREILLLDKPDNELARMPKENLPPLNHPSDLAYVIYTSGTTGRPKGALLEHRNITGLMMTGKNLFAYEEQDVWTMFHSYCFDFSVWEMYGALLFGGRLVLIPRILARDPKNYLEMLKKECITILNQTPGVFYRLIEEEMKTSHQELSVRCVIFGGEALSPGKLRPWKEKYPETRLINMYGITETTVHVTFKEITQQEINANISNIGQPIPTLFACIMDRHLRLVPAGAAGELYVGGLGVARGYLNRPELTAERFGLRRPGGRFSRKLPREASGHPRKSFLLSKQKFCGGAGGGFSKEPPARRRHMLYKSGDMVRLLENGEMEYLGRIDHQVKIRGNRVESGEVERQLARLDTVDDVVVIAREHDNGSHYLCAYIKPRQPGTVDVSLLRRALSKTLPDYMVPSHFIPMETFPLTVTGKVDRRKLPLPGGIRPQLGTVYEAPGDGMSSDIAAIWKDILKLDKVGIHDNFFDLGGSSLEIIRLKSRLEETLKKEIPVVTLFEHPTIHAFSRHLSRESSPQEETVNLTQKLMKGKAKMKGRKQNLCKRKTI